MSLRHDDGPIRAEIPAELEPLIPNYLDKRHADIGKMEAALEAGDLDSVREIGHAIKGSGGGYGFERLTELGWEIEKAATEGDAEASARAVDAMADYLRRVEVEYQD
jgi:HPt (histidine-containing phosphotransfer) domain-containing protein